jgi:glycosyltransferase involved in cell wall biosynthesis
MVRVLQVVHKMHRAGAETLLMQIYRNINRDIVQFDFAVHTDEPSHYDEEIRSLGGNIFRVPVSSRSDYWHYKQELREVLLRNGPYIGVHSHLLLLSGVIIGVASSAGIPLRLVHSHIDVDSKGNGLGRRIYRWYMRRQIRRYATHMFAVSRPAGEWLFGQNCWSDPRVQVVHNALDLSPYEALCEDKTKLRLGLGLPPRGILVGHVGRFVPQKNHRKIMEVFDQIVNLQSNAQLVLVGEGPLMEEANASAHSLGLQNQVHMLGVRNDIPEIMGALDVFLFPSLFEGLGIVLIEAQAAGVPCVVADTVPFEADVGLGLVEFLPLSARADIWANAAFDSLHLPIPPWSVRKKALKQEGYDIFEVVPWLQKVYSHAINSSN